MNKKNNQIVLKNLYLLLISLLLVNVTLTPIPSKGQSTTEPPNTEETTENIGKIWQVGITGEPPAVILPETPSNLGQTLTGISVEMTISGSKAVQWGQYYQGRMVEVDNLSDGIKQLESNQVDGVLYSRLVLEYYLYENPQAPDQVLDFDIGIQNYSIALTRDHPLTEKLNEQLLSIEMKLRFQEVTENWFQSQGNQ
ncbi:transporter substrate-binding domain-containing protein [Cyanothece sp. BG0011]|uniref:transporter substrate-binding domain-containing protein n=1 Tax=Cyanothece sp. BG0011 TaxID=2082950 RepID=UPI0018E59649|nr:transporter substrate-binding domain-containing protein [Cyanothece sp. BG0011]